jgi:benzoyl-CoA reductase subunit D
MSATFLTAGIDVGSSSVKSVVMRHDAADAEAPATLVAARADRIRRRDLRQVIDEGFDAALAEAGAARADVAYIATTGEGDLVSFRRGHFFGMTTHARGALYLAPQARAALDVGGLHARAIRMDERSRVLSHRMTSQCASGSGQFLENIARYLGVALEEVGPLSLEAKAPEAVSSICAVLAETDVINMVSRGISVRDILKGIHESMAGRYVRLLAAAGATGVVAVTGGLAADVGLVACLQDEAARQKVAIDVRAPRGAIHAGAIGAALWGAFRERRFAARAPASHGRAAGDAAA